MPFGGRLFYKSSDMQKFPLPGHRCAALGFSLALLWLVSPAGAAEGALRAAQPPSILLCLADNWSWPHAGVYGDKVVRTPNLDRAAREGVLFTHAFCASPSGSASRAAILTGQAPHRLEQGANLYGPLAKTFPVYPELLESAGYTVGMMRKGWGPGDFKAGGRARNPAGPAFRTFPEFFKSVPVGKPFCFWFGSHDPHRPYDKGFAIRSGMRPDQVVVPACLPDTPEVRSDILDYYMAIQRFDREVGQMFKVLEAAGRLDNTLVVITGDSGWPFPRGNANLYDSGTREPLIVRWPAKVSGGATRDDFINLTDLAPTFLEAAALRPAPEMTGHSFLGLLTGQAASASNSMVFLERERHANARKGDLGYPARAVRTREFLYVRNLRPDRWPAGDPEMSKSVGPFGDCDNSPTKDLILARRAEPAMAKLFELCFAKRPEEELYDLLNDPNQMSNVAGQPQYADRLATLRAELDRWMTETKDPRASGGGDEFDRYPYVGGIKKMRLPSAQPSAEDPDEGASQ